MDTKLTSPDAPQTAQDLADQLAQRQKMQKTMLAVNAYWGQTGTCRGAPGITEEEAQRLDSRLFNAGWPWSKDGPYSGYELGEGERDMRRLRGRLASARRREKGEQEER